MTGRQFVAVFHHIFLSNVFATHRETLCTSEGGVMPKCINELDRQTVTNRQKDRQEQWIGTDLKHVWRLISDRGGGRSDSVLESARLRTGNNQKNRGIKGLIDGMHFTHLGPLDSSHATVPFPYFLSFSHLLCPSSYVSISPLSPPFSLSLPPIILARPLGQVW